MLDHFDRIDTDRVNNLFEAIKKEQSDGKYSLGETFYGLAVTVAAVLTVIDRSEDRQVELLKEFSELVLKTRSELADVM